MQIVLKELKHCIEFSSSEMAIYLSNFYQNINKEINETIMGFCLRGFVSAYFLLNIIAECPESSYKQENTKQPCEK